MAITSLCLVKLPDGRVFVPGRFEFWTGFGSTVETHGPIMHFIINHLATRSEKTIFVCQKADGHYTIEPDIVSIAEQEGAILFAAVVAGREQRTSFFYCPASDDFFVNSVYDAFQPHRVPWEQKENILFWRGGVSGIMWRVNTVKECLTIPRTDVKLVDCYSRPGEYSPTDTPELFADKVGVLDQLKYKALLYVDGNSSASNATWIFATGCVPVFVSIHEFWFRDKLVPWVHYVPVEWDLSDLREKVQWIWDHDEDAKKIAENALEFSRTVLSCENQREYIKKEIDRVITNGQIGAQK